MASKRSPNWDKIRAAYEAGEGSYRQLADRFGVPFPTLRDRAKRESWVIRRNKTRTAIVTETDNELVRRKVSSNLSDLQIIDDAIQSLYEGLAVEPKSREGAANAIARLIQVKQEIAPPTADKLAEMAIAHGITPEEFVQALARKWQQQH